MLLVDVLVRRFAQGAKGMKVCPLLPGAEFARYNSLVDYPHHPGIFVVQHSNPAYLALSYHVPPSVSDILEYLATPSDT